MVHYLVIGFILAFALAIKAQDPFHSCIVPTYCRRGGDGPPEAIWTDLNGNVIVPPSDFVTTVPPTQPDPTTQAPPPTTPSDNAQIQELNNYINRLSEPGWFLGLDGYQFFLTPPNTFVTFSAAQTFCNGLGDGVEVASVGLSTRERRMYVIDNFLRTCINTHAVWIDLTDAAEEGIFRWSDGEEITPEAADWAPGQPDNYQDAACTVISRDQGLMYDDVPCEGSNNGILCQREIGLRP